MSEQKKVYGVDSKDDSLGGGVIFFFAFIIIIAAIAVYVFINTEFEDDGIKWTGIFSEEVEKIIGDDEVEEVVIVESEPEVVEEELKYLPVRLVDAVPIEIYYQTFPNESELLNYKKAMIRDSVRKYAIDFTFEEVYKDLDSFRIGVANAIDKVHTFDYIEVQEIRFPAYIMELLIQKAKEAQNIEYLKRQKEAVILESELMEMKAEAEAKAVMMDMKLEREKRLYEAETRKAEQEILNRDK